MASASADCAWHDIAAMWRRRPPDELTPREREVLHLVRLGLTNEEIAGRLGITNAGAKYHVSQILSKLGVATREEAAALELGEPPHRLWARWALFAGIAGAATVVAATAGLAVLAWAVIRTGGPTDALQQPLPGACGIATSSRIGGIITDPIAQTLEQVRALNACNQPDASTARATPSTWDTAHATVRERGASITKMCEPQCLPDDHTKVWIVEVHGTFVSPRPDYAGIAMVPDFVEPGQAPPTMPVAGTWFSIIPVWQY